jgi:hypothetical protein
VGNRGIPGALDNEVSVRELGTEISKETHLERFIKYWLKLWEVDDSKNIGDALRYQLKVTESN